jgi:hypothetical protein
MPTTLRSAIDALASTFAAAVTAAIRGGSLDDILALSDTERAPVTARRGPGRPPKAGGGTGTGDPGSDAGGSGRTGRAAGGGGQPDPLAVPAMPKAAAPRRAGRKAASAKRTTLAKKAPAPTKKAAKAGRLPRRSPADIANALAKVVALVKSDAGGLRAEQIRERLGMGSKEMPRVLKEGLAKKVLKSKGAKRSTTYAAG